jgi:hypothetical protein
MCLPRILSAQDAYRILLTEGGAALREAAGNMENMETKLLWKIAFVQADIPF